MPHGAIRVLHARQHRVRAPERRVELIIERAIRDELAQGAFAAHDAARNGMEIARERHHIRHGAARLRDHRLVIQRQGNSHGVARGQHGCLRCARRDVEHLVPEQSERAELALGIAPNLVSHIFVDRERQLEVSRGVRVHGKKLDLFHDAGKLPGDHDRAALLEAIRVGQVGDEFVPFGEEIRGLAQLVDGDTDHGDRDQNHESDAQLVPRESRGAFHVMCRRGNPGDRCCRTPSFPPASRRKRFVAHAARRLASPF